MENQYWNAQLFIKHNLLNMENIINKEHDIIIDKIHDMEKNDEHVMAYFKAIDLRGSLNRRLDYIHQTLKNLDYYEKENQRYNTTNPD